MFKVGDEVEWTSQSASVVKTKRGVITRIVPRGTRGNVYNPGMPRDHESYMVKVEKKFYWPRVSLLRKVES